MTATLWDGAVSQPVLMLADRLQLSFTGEGRARFRLAHSGGVTEPDPLGWADVSQLSALQPPAVAHGTILAPLVDVVTGPLTVVQYARNTARWLKVEPLQGDDEQELKACQQFRVTMEALPDANHEDHS